MFLQTWRTSLLDIYMRRHGHDPWCHVFGGPPRAETRPTGRAVSRKRLGDRDGPLAVCHCVYPPDRPVDRALCLLTFSHFLKTKKIRCCAHAFSLSLKTNIENNKKNPVFPLWLGAWSVYYENGGTLVPGVMQVTVSWDGA